MTREAKPYYRRHLPFPPYPSSPLAKPAGDLGWRRRGFLAVALFLCAREAAVAGEGGRGVLQAGRRQIWHRRRRIYNGRDRKCVARADWPAETAAARGGVEVDAGRRPTPRWWHPAPPSLDLAPAPLSLDLAPVAVKCGGAKRLWPLRWCLARAGAKAGAREASATPATSFAGNTHFSPSFPFLPSLCRLSTQAEGGGRRASPHHPIPPFLPSSRLLCCSP